VLLYSGIEPQELREIFFLLFQPHITGKIVAIFDPKKEPHIVYPLSLLARCPNLYINSECIYHFIIYQPADILDDTQLESDVIQNDGTTTYQQKRKRIVQQPNSSSTLDTDSSVSPFTSNLVNSNILISSTSSTASNITSTTLSTSSPPFGSPINQSGIQLKNFTTFGSNRGETKKSDSPFMKFTGSHLHIGSWTIHQKENTSDLYVVFDFKQQNICWYIVDVSMPTQDTTTKKETGLVYIKKFKIQFKFSDICGLNVYSTEGMKSLDLTVELAERPLFFKKQERLYDKENVNQSNMGSDSNTKWVTAVDFTNGQATQYKRHIIRFLGEEGKKVSSLLHSNEYFKKILENSKLTIFSNANDITFAEKK